MQPLAQAGDDLAEVPADVSVWEAATHGREIILDNTERIENAAIALQRQSEEIAKSDAVVNAAKKGRKVDPTYTPQTMEVASGVEYWEDPKRFAHLKREILDSYQKRAGGSVPLGSSLPHLTPEQNGRAAHVTSSRVVGQAVVQNENYVIHERFHQDQGPRSERAPSHDRFFATDSNGGVYGVTGAFVHPDDKEGHKLQALWQATVDMDRRDRSEKNPTVPLLNSKVHEYVQWTVDTGHPASPSNPPLSPRSMRRTLPDTGYMSVGKQKK